MRRQDPYVFRASTQSPWGFLVPILVLALVLMISFYAIKGLLAILSVVAPLLLIITFIIDREVITSYLQWLGRLLKDNVLIGVLAVVLSIVGFHVVSGFLFARALLRRQFKKVVDQMEEEREGKYVSYEEVTDEEDFLELPEPEPAQRSKRGNNYEDLFD